MTTEAHQKVTITKILTSSGAGKTFYRFAHTGGDYQVGLGDTQPKFGAGSVVSFTANQNGRGFWNVSGAVEVHEGVAPTAPETPAAAPAPKPQQQRGNTVSRDDYWANKEKRDLEKEQQYQEVDVPRMTYSAAQDRAVALISAALAHDCLALGQTKGKRLDILFEQVDKATERFLLQTMNAGEELKRIKAEKEKVEAAIPEGVAGDLNLGPAQSDEDDF